MKRMLVLCSWLLVAVQAFAGERVGAVAGRKDPGFPDQSDRGDHQGGEGARFQGGGPCDAVSRLVRGAGGEKRRMHVAHFRRRLSVLLRRRVD